MKIGVNGNRETRKIEYVRIMMKRESSEDEWMWWRCGRKWRDDLESTCKEWKFGKKLPRHAGAGDLWVLILGRMIKRFYSTHTKKKRKKKKATNNKKRTHTKFTVSDRCTFLPCFLYIKNTSRSEKYYIAITLTVPWLVQERLLQGQSTALLKRP